MYRLPFTLTCVALEKIEGGPLVLDCVVHDAEETIVRGRGNMRINVNAKSTAEDVSSILQSQANALAKDALMRKEAERVELNAEDTMKQLEDIVGQPFVGVAK